jgi:glutamate dehydrogenase/leucine dehydrogenase
MPSVVIFRGIHHEPAVHQWLDENFTQRRKALSFFLLCVFAPLRETVLYFKGGTEMKVIVIGCGRMGSTLARKLGLQGHTVTVIARNKSDLSGWGRISRAGR